MLFYACHEKLNHDLKKLTIHMTLKHLFRKKRASIIIIIIITPWIKISERSFTQSFDDSMSSFSSEERIKCSTKFNLIQILLPEMDT